MITKNYLIRTGLFMVFCILSSIGFAQTYTFTSAGVTGRTGPTQAQVNTAYTATTLDGLVNVTVTGIQEWVVPASGIYSFETSGASGGVHPTLAGHGAYVSGELNLTAGTTLYILVGQMGSQHATGSTASDGGGGGTFVTDGVNLLFASGGGGGSAQNLNADQDASITTAVANGSAGQFGSKAAGYTLNGSHFTYGVYTTVAQSFTNNGEGQAGGQAGGWPGGDYGDGGFGGGGSACSCSTGGGGGGGGYLGGGGGGNSPYVSGYGGSSYSIGTASNVTASVLPNLGDGQVVITSLCSPVLGSLIADAPSLADITEDCIAYEPVAPTATNSCATLTGTPDVTFPINTVGTTVITWTFDDGTNTTTQTQNLIISGIDGTPPVANNLSLPDMSSQCLFTPPTPTATDVCAGAISGVADVTFPLSTQGLTVITWTYDDGNGNIATQTQNITLNDVAPPNPDLTVLPDYTGCSSATPPTATATDYCAGAINGTPDVTFPITAAGPTTVTWTYVDGNGNTSFQTQDVYVTTLNAGVTVSNATITADANGLTYQWIDCSSGQAIAGETGQSYTATVTGDYAVIVSDATCTDTSACSLIDFSGIDELTSNPISIYPNPTNNGVFSIAYDGTIDQILVTDALGRVIQLPIDLATGKVDGSTLANGKYSVRVITTDYVYTKEILVTK